MITNYSEMSTRNLHSWLQYSVKAGLDESLYSSRNQGISFKKNARVWSHAFINNDKCNEEKVYVW